jgi:hypothetical protein
MLITKENMNSLKKGLQFFSQDTPALLECKKRASRSQKMNLQSVLHSTKLCQNKTLTHSMCIKLKN